MFLTLNHICTNINIYIYIYNKISETKKKSSVRRSRVEIENENEKLCYPHSGWHPTTITSKEILNRLKFRFCCFGLIDLIVWVYNLYKIPSLNILLLT